MFLAGQVWQNGVVEGSTTTLFDFSLLDLSAFEEPTDCDVKLEDKLKGIAGCQYYYSVRTPYTGPIGESVTLTVIPGAGSIECSCIDFVQEGGCICKHVLAVLFCYQSQNKKSKSAAKKEEAARSAMPAQSDNNDKSPEKLHPLEIGRGTFNPTPVESPTWQRLEMLFKRVTEGNVFNETVVAKLTELKHKYADPNWQRHHRGE